MEKLKDLIIVTNWEKVDKNNFYLSNDWANHESMENIQEARKLQKKGLLYVAYIVSAVNYAIYLQMDADQVFVNDECDIILYCETGIIDNNHQHKKAFEF